MALGTSRRTKSLHGGFKTSWGQAASLPVAGRCCKITPCRRRRWQRRPRRPGFETAAPQLFVAEVILHSLAAHDDSRTEPSNALRKLAATIQHHPGAALSVSFLINAVLFAVFL